MKSLRPLVAVSVCAFLLSSCSLPWQQQSAAAKEKAEKEDKIPAMPAPLHLGAVHQVYPEQRFCLLRMLGPIPKPGTTLISHPADGSSDRIGNLCVSNSQGSHNGMIAADIRSGTVIKGDRVFLYRTIAAPERTEEETTTEEPATDETSTPASNSGDDTVLEQTPVADTLPATPTPQPVQDNAPSADTTVVPEGTTPGTEETEPSERLNDIPDTISGWDNM